MISGAVWDEASDDAAALCDLDPFAVLEKALDLPESVAEVADRSGLHPIHCRIP
jgi:hypothetical protein